MTQLPAVSTFGSDSSVLRAAMPPLSAREEVRLQILARELVRYSPEFASLLAEAGMRDLRSELAFA